MQIKVNNSNISSLLFLHKIREIAFMYKSNNVFMSYSFYASWLDSCSQTGLDGFNFVVKDIIDVIRFLKRILQLLFTLKMEKIKL